MSIFSLLRIRIRSLFAATAFVALAVSAVGQIPAEYPGKPFADAYHKAGPANIPGIVECALFDLGGEGVAYHDTTSTNEPKNGS